MKILIPILSCALFICFISPSQAQEITKQEKGYFNLTELGYFRGNEVIKTQSTTGTNVYKAETHALSLRNINGWFVTNKFSAGIGAGLENYTNRRSSLTFDNIFLLFADFRYYLNNDGNTFFAYADAGGSVAINDNIEKGPMFNAGVGYKFKLGNRSAMNVSAGYINQTINGYPNIESYRYSSMAFKVGLLL